MPRTIENIVENHRAGAKRRAAGKPTWDRTINIKTILREDPGNKSNDRAADVANRIGALLRRLLPATWLNPVSDEFESDVFDLVEGMEALRPDSYRGEEDFTPLDDLNNMLDGLYDWANSKRIWLGN